MWLTFAMALLRVGLGVLFFAPKSRFMVGSSGWDAVWYQDVYLTQGDSCSVLSLMGVRVLRLFEKWCVRSIRYVVIAQCDVAA